jgi:hypothetical protein
MDPANDGDAEVQLNVFIPVSLDERLKDAIYAERHRWDQRKMVRAALMLYLAKLEQDRGDVYPFRPEGYRRRRGSS